MSATEKFRIDDEISDFTAHAAKISFLIHSQLRKKSNEWDFRLQKLFQLKTWNYE